MGKTQHDPACAGHGHSHGHGHGHGHHDHAHGVVGNIRFAFFLNITFSLVEMTGGLLIGSMAVVAGAIHDLGDSLSLGTAWGLEIFARRERDRRFNFGYRRFSLLSALISGIVISTGAAIIIFESIRRFGDFQEPPPGKAMIGLSMIGLVINGIAAWRLSRGQTLNEKVLTWHSIEDVMSWAIVLAGAAAIAWTHASWLDPVLAIALGCFVLFNVLKHLKSTVYLFLQGRPINFDEDLFLREALSAEGVEHVDHLAVWSLDGQTSILSARLHLHSVRDPDAIEKVKAVVRAAAARQKAVATLETCMAAHAPHEVDPSAPLSAPPRKPEKQ